MVAARWGQEGAYWLSHCSLDLTAPAGVAGQVPENSGHRWQRRKGRQEVAGGKTAAQTVSAQSTSYCLDGKENVTNVACYRIFKPVGQTYLCPNSIFSGPNLVVEALEGLQVGPRVKYSGPERQSPLHGVAWKTVCSRVAPGAFPNPEYMTGLALSGFPPRADEDTCGLVLASLLQQHLSPLCRAEPGWS